jgi:uncharacterized protein
MCVYYYNHIKKNLTVNYPRNPLRFNVGFLLHQQVGYNRDIHFEYPDILLQDDLNLTDFQGVARLSRTPQGILVQGEFKGVAQAECVRCLSECTQPLSTQFSELYAVDERYVTDSGLILPEDGNIDLEPLVREYLLIEFPISPVCRDDCQGLCTICGQNLNEELCEHYTPDNENETQS